MWAHLQTELIGREGLFKAAPFQVAGCSFSKEPVVRLQAAFMPCGSRAWSLGCRQETWEDPVLGMLEPVFLGAPPARFSVWWLRTKCHSGSRAEARGGVVQHSGAWEAVPVTATFPARLSPAEAGLGFRTHGLGCWGPATGLEGHTGGRASALLPLDFVTAVPRR